MTQRSSKAQLITMLVLVLFLLMVTLLLSFVAININTNSAAQSLAVSLSSSNYGTALSLSAGQFAKASASTALSTLAAYEMTPSLRKGNLISNFGLFMSQLTINGMIPNDTSGYPQNAMKNLTLAAYNASIAKLLGFASQAVVINETRPVFFQPDPYHLGIRYTENIAINATGNMYRFNIPVNASISLNNTPDLFYAQQGLLRSVKFASIRNMSSMVGNVYAASGNAIGYAYGTVNSITSSATASATSCPDASVPAALRPYVILATYNALSLGACVNSYGGLITYVSPSSAPTGPYLVFAASSNVLQSLPTGMRVLLYGPGMDVLNIEGLRSAISNGYYFSSPFTPSYIDRSAANFPNQSQNGIFTFSNYNTQAARFDGMGSYVGVASSGVSFNGKSAITITTWIYPTSFTPDPDFSTLVTKSQAYYLQLDSTGRVGAYLNGINSAYFYSQGTIPLNAWSEVTFTYDGSKEKIFINGKSDNSIAISGNIGDTSPYYLGLGANLDSSGNPYSGYPRRLKGNEANAQLYSVALSSVQVMQLYQEGISNLPIWGNSLVGWWPLNGNANDISGNGNNGIPTNLVYTLLPNYTRDSILNTPIPTPLSLLPGILSCNSNSQCTSNSLPHLYLSQMPLEVQRVMQAAYSGTMSDCLNLGYVPILINSVGQSTLGAVSIAWWSYPINPWVFLHLNSGNGNPGGSGVYCQASSCQIPNTGIGGPLVAPNNVWSFFTLTLSSTGTATYYINGNPGTPGAWSGPLTSVGYFALLGYDPACSDLTKGLMSNVQLYSNSLTQSQISQLYQRGVQGLPLPGNLIGWWPLSGDAKDYGGYGNNGIETNAYYPFSTAPSNSAITNEWQSLGINS